MEQEEAVMIVTAHQPNFLPGLSVVSKVRSSDAVIWLDEVQYTKNGWINRNKYKDAWLTVPVAKHTDGKPINRVEISEHNDWRRQMVGRLRATEDPLGWEILRPYRLLVGLNLALLRLTFDASGVETPWHFQSHLDGGHAVVAQSDDREMLLPISHRLAMMVEELGGSVYLSGPSGRNYLDETPFTERHIKVQYWSHVGKNPSILETYLEHRPPRLR